MPEESVPAPPAASWASPSVSEGVLILTQNVPRLETALPRASEMEEDSFSMALSATFSTPAPTTSPVASAALPHALETASPTLSIPFST